MLDPGRHFLQAARHVELEVVPARDARVVHEVSHRFGAGSLEYPDNLVSRVQVQHDFRLDFVLLHHGRHVLPEVVAEISEGLVG